MRVCGVFVCRILLISHKAGSTAAAAAAAAELCCAVIFTCKSQSQAAAHASAAGAELAIAEQVGRYSPSIWAGYYRVQH